MAAGLGFKTFNTGDVLSAADTNGYLMQGVLVFANAAARDAAITSPQEGQCCYLKDTDAVQTYSGTAWVGFDDSNAIQNSLVDAKGDIVAASGNDTPARLAVGNNGETLVADSSTSTGLKWVNSPTFIGCRAYLTTNQTISNSTGTLINFAAESYDTNSFHDNTTNNTRLTVPTGYAGYYNVTGQIRYDVNGVGRRLATILVNGAGAALVNGEVTPGASVYPSILMSSTIYLANGDYVAMNGFQTSGGNLAVLANSTDTYLQLEKVGQ